MRKQPFIWFTFFMLICMSLSLVLAACGEATLTTNPNTTAATKTSELVTTSASSTTATNTPGSTSGTTVAATTPAATTAAASTAAASSGKTEGKPADWAKYPHSPWSAQGRRQTNH